ncbi:MAG TPA: GatB/YqeY domain-containing protein [Aequorivita sp.]|nr:GatB/YqeY domain-containing protein [Aequorivita sp.]
MSLNAKITEALKEAMRAKDTTALEALRAIKSALLLASTESGSKAELSEADEIKLVQRLVKQRNDSAQIYTEQGRADLAEPELAQIKVIEQFLPEPMTDEEVKKIVDEVISQTGASSMADMGKVMGMVTAKVSGRADGKTISGFVKEKLSS